MSVKVQRGPFVVVEGPDASGKTTLTRRLIRDYRRAGIPVCSIREPGGTPVSERIRRILLDPQADIDVRAELFLYLAARAQVVADVICPAIERGELVIADRFSLSTLAYQVGGRGLPLRAVRDADRLARGGLAPDLEIVLRVTPRQQTTRRSQRTRDRIEQESARFFQTVRSAYERFARPAPGRLVVDSGIGADAVREQATAAIDKLLRKHRIRPR